MTYLDEERERAKIKADLRCERIRQVRAMEREQAKQRRVVYQSILSTKQAKRQEVAEQTLLKAEQAKLQSIIENWNAAVLNTGEAHRIAKTTAEVTQSTHLEAQVAAAQRKLVASNRQIEVLPCACPDRHC